MITFLHFRQAVIPSLDLDDETITTFSVRYTSISKIMASPNPIVFFDITLAGEPLGRVKMELFADVTPRTAEYVCVQVSTSTLSLLYTFTFYPPILQPTH